jgi:hypothetical protein
MIIDYCPMCYNAWLRDESDSTLTNLYFTEGFQEALFQRVPSRSWTIWRHECVWMSLYFVFGGIAAVSNVSLPPGVRPILEEKKEK